MSKCSSVEERPPCLADPGFNVCFCPTLCVNDTVRIFESTCFIPCVTVSNVIPVSFEHRLRSHISEVS